MLARSSRLPGTVLHVASGVDGTEPGSEGEDPFLGLELDEQFVAAAPVREGSAEARARRARLVAGLYRQQHIRMQEERARRKMEARIRRRHWRSWMLMLLAGVGLGGWFWSTAGSLDSSSRTWGTSNETFVHDSTISRFPPPPEDLADVPLGEPLQPDHPSPAFEFTTLQADGARPVAYDPCRPIQVVINPRTSPPEGRELVDAAIAEVSRVTGLRFVVESVTDEPPTHPRPPLQEERYGNRWAPVLIAWSDPAESEVLSGDVAGVAGSQAMSRRSDELVYVTGTVVLDGPQFEEILARPDGYSAARAVVVHELGHLVGLDHIEAESELMHPEGRVDVTDFGPGDLTGLAELGAGVCQPDL